MKLYTPRDIIPPDPYSNLPSVFFALLRYQVSFFIAFALLAPTFVWAVKQNEEVLQFVTRYQTVIGAPFALFVFGLWALSPKAARLRSQHPYSFWGGLRQAMLETKMALAFLPGVGFLFGRNTDIHNRKGNRNKGQTPS